MTRSYTITEYEHGLHVTGPLPMHALSAIGNMANELGHTHLHPGIAKALSGDGGFAFASPDAAEAWAAELAAAAEEVHPADKLAAWLAGPSTGLSARTIAHHLGGAPACDWGDCYPHDADDLGRCIRLVDLMDWHDRMGEMAGVRGWAVPSARWSELVEFHRNEQWEEVYALLSGRSA